MADALWLSQISADFAVIVRVALGEWYKYLPTITPVDDANLVRKVFVVSDGNGSLRALAAGNHFLSYTWYNDCWARS